MVKIESKRNGEARLRNFEVASVEKHTFLLAYTSFISLKFCIQVILQMMTNKKEGMAAIRAHVTDRARH